MPFLAGNMRHPGGKRMSIFNKFGFNKKEDNTKNGIGDGSRPKADFRNSKEHLLADIKVLEHKIQENRDLAGETLKKKDEEIIKLNLQAGTIEKKAEAQQKDGQRDAGQA